MNTFEEQEYTKKLDLALWKKLLKFAIPHKKQLIILIVVSAFMAVVDAIFPLFTRYAVDNFITPGRTNGLTLFSVFYVTVGLVQAFNVYTFIKAACDLESFICTDIRYNAFRKLQELSLSYYDKTPVGWIMARMTSDIMRIGQIIAWGLVNLVWGGAVMVGIVAVMFVLNWKLALATLSVIPLLAVISVYFQNRILKAYRKVRKTNSKITGAFNEGIMGAKTSKTLAREDENLEEFQQLTGQMYRYSNKAAILSSIYMPLVLLLSSIGIGMALWHGGEQVGIGLISYGTLVAFVNYAIWFFEPVKEIARIFAELQYAQASGERVLSLIETEAEVKDSEEVRSVYGDLFEKKTEEWPGIKGRVTFDNVSFVYSNGEKVLENFNLEVAPGETIALVGETGAGKSTIVNLACRFYEPTSGRILIDGVDYRERSQSWLQSRLGYVLQTPHLFSGTVMENIRYGKMEATDEEVIEAAKAVSAHEFILKLENGYSSDVGEGGNRLSTGQKQLISFARAVLADPAIFVLDEATSSIDTETEQAIQQAISRILKDRTSFVIAHRLSTVKNAHRILVLHDGEVVEEGTHKQLISRRGMYYELYANQYLDERTMGILNIT
ncbi:MAG: ABC transporter ATP-binding protein [Eubacteriales bacterium]|nr:ABC transporter ATP-binding protein [Eubacteriales bacterium]